MSKRIILLGFVFWLIAGCAVGPDYRRPEVKAPAAWRFADAEARRLVNARWWEQLGDPVLDDLIEAALQENKDVLIAAARIEEYGGRYVATRGELFPRAGLDAQATRQRATEAGVSGWPAGVDNPYPTYQIYLNASWEIDLWGKLRRGTEAARAELLARKDAHRALLLSLAASVAGAYIDLRNYDRQLAIARETLKTREASLEIFRLRYEAGVISELELSQVLSEYENARATIPQIEKAIAQQENAVTLLLGRNPGPVQRGRSIDELALPAVPAGLPSALLERRPDIRQAEQDLIAANARIGVARAAYFPAISLTGTFGNASADLTRLFTAPARIWTLGASITMPIFTAERTRGQVQASEAQQKQALLTYLKTVQTAFKEVEDALADQKQSRMRLDAQFRQVNALRNYRDLAVLRYENGYSGYLEVLDAERNLFSVELNYIQTRGGLFRALVDLYKAMGGGWTADH